MNTKLRLVLGPFLLAVLCLNLSNSAQSCEPKKIVVDVATWRVENPTSNSELDPDQCFQSNSVIQMDVSEKTQKEILQLASAYLDIEITAPLDPYISSQKREDCVALYGKRIQASSFSVVVMGVDSYGDTKVCNSFYRWRQPEVHH